jgi:hypothetical protein
VRSRNGTFTTFDVPGAVNGLSEPLVINPEGAITGTFADANVALHGFLRAKNGTFITFDAPGAGTGFFQGTQALGINLQLLAVTSYGSRLRRLFSANWLEPLTLRRERRENNRRR